MIPTKQILKKDYNGKCRDDRRRGYPTKNFLKRIAGDEKKLEDGKRTRLKLHR